MSSKTKIYCQRQGRKKCTCCVAAVTSLSWNPKKPCHRSYFSNNRGPCLFDGTLCQKTPKLCTKRETSPFCPTETVIGCQRLHLTQNPTKMRTFSMNNCLLLLCFVCACAGQCDPQSRGLSVVFSDDFDTLRHVLRVKKGSAEWREESRGDDTLRVQMSSVVAFWLCTWTPVHIEQIAMLAKGTFLCPCFFLCFLCA